MRVSRTCVIPRFLVGGAALAGLAALPACGGSEDPALEPISHATVADSLTVNTESALNGIANASTFLLDSSAIVETLSAFSMGESGCDSATVNCSATDPNCVPETDFEDDCSSDELTSADLHDAKNEFHEAVSDLSETLRNEIFTQANVESEDGTSVTYLMKPELFCESSDTETSIGPDGVTTTSSEPDPECLDEFSRLALRLRVTSPSEGNLDVQVLMTEQRYTTFLFELHQNRLAVTADLGQLALAAEAMGGDLDGLESLAGQWQLELVENAALDYSLRSNILEDIRMVANSDGKQLEIHQAKSAPAFELNINGNTQVLTASYDLRALRIAGPLSLFSETFEGDSTSSSDSLTVPGEPIAPTPEPEPEPVYTGMIEFLLAGLSGSVSFTGQQDLLQFENLGLGDQTSTLKHDGNTLLAVDVNPEHRRRFDMTVQGTGDQAQFTFTPTLDVSVLFQFSHIADQFDDIPEDLMNNALRFWFDGDSPTIAANDDQLRVVSGTLHVSSSATPEENLDVAAGMCLTDAEDDAPIATPVGTPSEEPAAEPEEGGLLSGLEVTACE